MKLPKYICPIKKTDLVRLGRNNDGGYAVSKKSIDKTQSLISFGISDDWSFEQSFKLKKDIKIICFDNSVNLAFWLRRFIRDTIDLFLFRNNALNIFKRFFTYFNYLSFFLKKDSIHEKKFIAPIQLIINGIQKKNVTDVDQIVKKYNLTNFFLKVDIEGNEYRILDQIIKNEKNITGLVIEFHDCDYHFEKIKNFIKSFDLELVHIHINNYGIIDKFGRPTVLELTFSPKEFNQHRTEADYKFPVPELDQPNDKSKQDKPIEFE